MRTVPACVIAILMAICSVPAHADDLPPGVLFIAKAKRRIAQTLGAVPNYTCLETIAREQLKPAARTFQRLDLVRLEVARVENRELFAWPGAGRFEEKPITDFVGGGLIGDGVFSLFAEDLFLNGASVMRFRGPEQLQGKPSVRIDYTVSALRSKFTLVTAAGQGEVSYSGSFWTDPESLDLIRLEVRADDIPPQLQLSAVSIAVEYGEAALAQHASMEFVKVSGEISRDQIEFTGCRKFTGDAKMRFDSEDATQPAEVVRPSRTSLLPGGLAIPLRLRTPIDAASAGVGDAVVAEVDNDVKDKGQVWLPKGTLVEGRIRRVELRHGAADYVLLGLEFSTAQIGPDRAAFIAELQSLGPSDTISMRRQERQESRRVNQPNGLGTAGTIETTVVESFDDALPGVGYLYLSSAPFTAPRGLRMVWKTQSVRQKETVR